MILETTCLLKWTFNNRRYNHMAKLDDIVYWSNLGLKYLGNKEQGFTMFPYEPYEISVSPGIVEEENRESDCSGTSKIKLDKN